MQEEITIPVIDSRYGLAHTAAMLTHEEILAELIRQVAAKQIKQSFVAEQLGIAPPRVTEIRKRKRKIQPNEMPVLASLLGLTNSDTATKHPVSYSVGIPILGRVAVGVWLEQSFVDADDAEKVTYDRLPGDASPESLFAVTPEGDSMNLAFPDKSILICRHLYNGHGQVKAGDYVIVERHAHDLRELTCKRLEIAENGDYLLCSESSNPKYSDPIVVPRSLDDEHVDNGVSILGKVVRVVLDFERV